MPEATYRDSFLICNVLEKIGDFYISVSNHCHGITISVNVFLDVNFYRLVIRSCIVIFYILPWCILQF